MEGTFLIVDDAPPVRLTLERMLRQQEIAEDRIHSADSGEEALEVFRAERPEVVFMDVRMPGMGGEQTASTMLMEAPETKIVVITGETRDDEQVKRLISLGAFEVIEKPIRAAEIREVLRIIEEESGRAGRIK